ncbi:AraC family transcriptional regulator [Poseidonocella sp. HB161398]|uniref:AraC family transcriptional regulator n=1 Tax=Poseidonocella sp. HB161398 TaxID=2320855 RepID=UPI0011087A84|nr:AraC family transcriptional regulator [Poseidonocella sp. HB161398]
MGGYVRASALAPIRACVEHAGGRIAPVLRAAALPPEILDRPDLVLPLADHYAVLEAAARETGRGAFGARMGAAARIGMLGPYGAQSLAAPTLGAAIARAGALLNAMMQTDTDLVLIRLRDGVKWSMVFHTRGGAGRYQNELLAIGYQLDLMRHFLGPGWRPACLHLRPSGAAPRAELERIFRAPVRIGEAVPGIAFDPRCLATLAPAGPETAEAAAAEPMPADALPTIRAAIRLELLSGRPGIDRVAARMGMSRRSLQRRLAAAGSSYGGLLGAELCREAGALLAAGGPVGEIADRLGYADPAHFTRAYRRWTGFAPREHRLLLAQKGNQPGAS